jgi:hypothetical protein
VNDGAEKPRITMQTFPLSPRSATTNPIFVRTSIVAWPETLGGAAVRARAISAARGMRYWSTGGSFAL